jgi:hypothetical protein
MKHAKKIENCSFPCPRCLEPNAMADAIMCGVTRADGPLTYWRCKECGLLFSELTRLRSQQATAPQA